MAKGILMSKTGEKGIVLTKEGTFENIRLPHTNVAIGDEINGLPQSKRRFKGAKAMMTALAAACLLLVAFFGTLQFGGTHQAVAAYISFDINPSFEAGIDQDLHIVRLKSMDSDGAKLIQAIPNYKNMTLEQFSEKVAEILDQEGYFNQPPQVVVSTTLTDKGKREGETTLSKKIDQAVQKIAEQKDFVSHQGTLDVIQTSTKDRQQAQKAGLTAGKYALYLKAKKASPEVTPEKAKNMTVKQLLQKTQSKVQDQLQKNQKGKTNNGTPSDHSSNGKKDQAPGQLKDKKNNSQQENPKDNPKNSELGNSSEKQPKDNASSSSKGKSSKGSAPSSEKSKGVVGVQIHLNEGSSKEKGNQKNAHSNKASSNQAQQQNQTNQTTRTSDDSTHGETHDSTDHDKKESNTYSNVESTKNSEPFGQVWHWLIHGHD